NWTLPLRCWSCLRWILQAGCWSYVSLSSVPGLSLGGSWKSPVLSYWFRLRHHKVKAGKYMWDGKYSSCYSHIPNRFVWSHTADIACRTNYIVDQKSPERCYWKQRN